MTDLTPETAHRILAEFLPALNDDFPCDDREELGELLDFGEAYEEYAERRDAADEPGTE